MVQPDLCVFCDESKLDDKGGIAAPDLVVEILSPGNTQKEMKIKFDLYESHGVLEYWLVHPLDKTILIYHLENERFLARRPLTEEDVAVSTIFPEIQVVLKEIF